MIWGIAPNGAPVKTAAHFFGASLNCDIAPDWRTPRAMRLRRHVQRAADGFGVPFAPCAPLCAAVGSIEKRRAMVAPVGRQIPCAALLDENQYRASAQGSI